MKLEPILAEAYTFEPRGFAAGNAGEIDAGEVRPFARPQNLSESEINYEALGKDQDSSGTVVSDVADCYL
jgi:hypothetical protein